MVTAQLDERAARRSPASPARGGRHLSLVVAVGPPDGGPRAVVRPGGGLRPVRAGCAGRRPGSARVAGPVAPPLRLTRRGRRLVAGLLIAGGIALAAAVGGAVFGGGSDGLRLAGDSSVVVRSGDTLWSIAGSAAPEEDPRAVVDAIVALNGLEGVGLVPGQVLQLP